MQVTHYFTASLTAPAPAVLYAVKGDGARMAVARLMAGAEPWAAPEGVTAGISYTLPDKTPGYYDRLEGGTPACMIAGNLVSAVLAPVLTGQAGAVKVSIVLRDADGGQVATFPIQLRVEQAPGIVDAEGVPAMGSGFEGKLFYGGPGGALTALGLGDGVRVEAREDGTLALVAEGGSGGGGGIIEEKDPTVYDWAKQPQKPSYTAQEVGAMPAGTKIPGKTSELTNDAGFVDKAVNDLANYYTKVQTQELIAAIPRFRVTVVQQLPAAGEELVLYLVPFATAEGQYLEYIWADGRWEIIGSQRVDLTGYATEVWVKDYVEEHSGQNVALYIGPDEPTGENRPLYWLDTSMDDVPAVPEEPDVPVEPEEPDPEKTLTGITAAYTGGDVAVGTAASALTGITVTASYSDGSTEAVTGYTLSGTIGEGSNTVTVTYQGKTATFTVTGVAESGGEEPDDGMTTYHIPDVAVSSTVSGTKTIYTVENVKVGDIFRVCVPAMNDTKSALIGDGITLSPTTSSENNYADNYAELTAPASFGEMKVYAGTEKVAAGKDCWWKHNPDADDIWLVSVALTKAALDNDVTSVAGGGSYTAGLTAADGYKLDTVTVTMGGVEITAEVYADGIITIPAVTGTVKIKATAIAENIYYLADIASEVEEGKIANGNTKNGYTRYKVEGIKAGDVVRLASSNADNASGWYDGATSHALTDTTMFTKTSMDNYSWYQYSWTADADYAYLYFASNTGFLETRPKAKALIEKAVN